METKGTENDEEDSSSDGEGDMIGTVIRMDEMTEKILVLKHDSGFVLAQASATLLNVKKVQVSSLGFHDCVADDIFLSVVLLFLQVPSLVPCSASQVVEEVPGRVSFKVNGAVLTRARVCVTSCSHRCFASRGCLPFWVSGRPLAKLALASV